MNLTLLGLNYFYTTSKLKYLYLLTIVVQTRLPIILRRMILVHTERECSECNIFEMNYS